MPSSASRTLRPGPQVPWTCEVDHVGALPRLRGLDRLLGGAPGACAPGFMPSSASRTLRPGPQVPWTCEVDHVGALPPASRARSPFGGRTWGLRPRLYAFVRFADSQTGSTSALDLRSGPRRGVAPASRTL